MESKTDISFIVPAYNSQSYIERCLDSIYGLDFENYTFEVIVVDDCSTDETLPIVLHYRSKLTSPDSLVVLKQPYNNKQGAARNRGLGVSRGEYIMFADSDDEVQPGIVEALSQAKNNGLDIVALHHTFEDISDGNKTNTSPAPLMTFTASDVFDGNTLYATFPWWSCAPWSYLFSRDFIDRVAYPFAEGVYYEDSDFVTKHLSVAHRIGYQPTSCYFVHANASSTTRAKVTHNKLADFYLLGVRMLHNYETLPDKTTPYAQAFLEGGSDNVSTSFRRLYHLRSLLAVIRFYRRIDRLSDRKPLLSYHEPKRCWTPYVRFCLRMPHF